MNTLLTITGLPCGVEADLIVVLVIAYLGWSIASAVRSRKS